MRGSRLPCVSWACTRALAVVVLEFFALMATSKYLEAKKRLKLWKTARKREYGSAAGEARLERSVGEARLEWSDEAPRVCADWLVCDVRVGFDLYGRCLKASTPRVRRTTRWGIL